MRYILDIEPMRLAAKKTREELALALGVKPLAIYTWETRRKQPSVKQLGRMAEHLECRPGDFFCREQK